MKNYIKGIYKQSIYKSDKGYHIGIFKLKETNDENMNDYVNKTITFTGYFAELNENDMYTFYGELITHPKYGVQYTVEDYERVKPEDKDGIIQFLSSDLFPTVGEKLATTIVNTLGETTLERILLEEGCLNLVPKLSNKKAKLIYETLIKYEESHKIIVYLTDLGFPIKDALVIYNKYKSNTINIIEHNIFKLLDEELEISFTKIDEISNKMGIEENDERRIIACILFVFKNITFQTGNTYLTYDDIKIETIKYLNNEIDDDMFINYLDILRFESKIILEGEKFYLKDIYDAENNIIKKINYLINKPLDKFKQLDKFIKNLEEELNIEYNDKQKEAIKESLENNIVIITGGPGTGKTTIIKAIVSLYKNINAYNYDQLVKNVALLAPTGRASKRMSESTLLPASTIHRFLKWNKDTNEFAINEFDKDNSNLIIVDEVSMIDINLMDNLLKGLTNAIKLVLVGDFNQLPSVGPGEVLKDLIECGVIKKIELDHLYRQDDNSYIPALAKEIVSNSLNESFLETRCDYTFLKCNSNSIKSNLRTLCEQIISKCYDLKKIQVMAPIYRGENGIDNLNKELQEVFNPKSKTKKEIKYGDVTFRENDKILQLVNMPDENVFNGDIGFIKYIIAANISESGKNEIHVDYDGLEVIYLPKDFNKIKHGFIISIHKSQGSEFDIVVLPFTNSYGRMLYRKLIYTGITRAKKKLILIGEPQAFVRGIECNYDSIRKTNLNKKIKENCIKK
ncbi:MAG: ATP-dependent RecD-like DNA helicase [Bacilli bacterium]